MKKHVPNAITCLNLFSGCVGLVFCFENHLTWACYAIFLAAVFDFLDGMFARLLRAYSPIGKELDSLADMVSFGVLPATIMYALFVRSGAYFTTPFLPYTAFLIAVFSALRLAKFNIDERQAENFIGLPTPANALFIASLPLILMGEKGSWVAALLDNPWVLLLITIIMPVLLVSELPLISLKFRNLSWADNRYRYILLIGSVIFIALFTFAAVPLILALYLIISVVSYRFSP
ncbi:MAG: CDP-diacylglycerol--serine O-phosphatidyltransferase [Mucilaginibacter polytrichastri]|nr:CDP-diacylglycerol--serine O-phosphatidyltransferase [Mucilaginibacter polytrichastri]